MAPSSEESAEDAAQRPTAREKGVLPDSRAPLPVSRKERRRQANPDHKGHLREILDQAKGVDFRSRGGEIEIFEKKNRLELTKKSENTENILHVLAARSNWPHWTWWPEEKIEQFLNWLLNNQLYHVLLKPPDMTKHTPLHTALLHQNDAFVDTILRHKKLEKFQEILTKESNNENCLHLAIRGEYDGLELLIKKCAEHESLFSKKDKNWDTPLHAAVRKVYPGQMKEILRKWKLIPETGASQPTEDQVAPEDQEGPADGEESEDEDYQLKNVILLIAQCRDALWNQNPGERTPYQERLEELSKTMRRILQHDDLIPYSDSINNAFREIVLEDRIAYYIRSYCIRELLRDSTMKCLYKPGQERQIEFDLAGRPNSSISTGYLDRLGRHLHFESMLKYVALPRLSVEKPRRAAKRMNRDVHSEARGLSDLTAVFSWLRGKHVKKIVKVIVIDDGNPSHSDKAIIDALEGFEIEVWDWKKIDICSDVIYNATKPRLDDSGSPSKSRRVSHASVNAQQISKPPSNARVVFESSSNVQESPESPATVPQVSGPPSNLREVSLYSTGNNAVLMGWASEEGLRDRKKFPKLRMVRLFIREGLEDSKTQEGYIGAFITKLKNGTGGRIDVRVIPDNEEVSYASELRTNVGLTEEDNPWIKCMQNFARFVRNIPAKIHRQPIKIAIIDDGVDGFLDLLDGKITAGKSFYPYSNSGDLMNSYYVPSGKHGTGMAALICQICPKCELFVARLEERYTMDGKRHITAKSAKEAIDWAVSCHVDIISMSWTIETSKTDDEHMVGLYDAITAADLAHILMFCSASDQGSISSDQCYPGNWKKCIRIGAATATGEKFSWVNREQVDFLFPGENFSFKTNDGTSQSFPAGSSVATAAASGLAGLLLYCNALVEDPTACTNSKTNIRTMTKMAALFTRMSTENKFLNAKTWFHEKFQTQVQKVKKAQGRSSGSVPVTDLLWADTKEAFSTWMNTITEA